MKAIGPYFLCIGAQKAGTTWLYANLKTVSGVTMPPLKEIHYFDELYKHEKTSLFARITAKEGMNRWWWKEELIRTLKSIKRKKSFVNASWYFRYFFLPRNFAWYKKLFSVPGNKKSGDITPDYCILDKDVIGLIHKKFPKLKIIYLIRNPVDRAWSALKMRYIKRRGFQFDQIDETLIEEYYEKFSAFNDIERTINNWTAFFPKNQFYIGMYDELVENPIVFFNKILDFLELSQDYDMDKAQKFIFKGVSGQIPHKLELMLYRKSIKQIQFVNQYLSGYLKKYPTKWLRDAEVKLGSQF